MGLRLHYGPTAKALHWLVVALLTVQFPIGWLMPDIHRGATPGAAMTLHVSIGITILIVMSLRAVWRIAYPVAPESSLPGWQRLSSEFVHWLLYVAIFVTTLTGWLFASFRGWTLSFFYLAPLPTLAAESAANRQLIDGWHQAAEWMLLGLVGVHVATAFAHIFIYRDQIMQRMLPQKARP